MTSDQSSGACKSSIRQVVSKSLGGVSLQYDWTELGRATDSFASTRVIGRGSHSNIFRGSLEGLDVAAKVLKGPFGAKECQDFEHEVRHLSRCRHPNIVMLMGFAVDSEQEQRALVYEMLSGGSVFTRLHRFGGNYSWRERLQTALDVCRGLTHLHKHRPKVFHCDIRSANVLFNIAGVAKIANFGLACSSQSRQDIFACMTVANATRGYTAPESAKTNIITEASEVYSTGMILLELLTGRLPAYRVSGSSDWEILLDTVRPELGDASGRVLKILDDRPQWPAGSAATLTGVSLSCIHSEAPRRPSFSELLGILMSLRAASLLNELPCFPEARQQAPIPAASPAIPPARKPKARAGSGGAASDAEVAAPESGTGKGVSVSTALQSSPELLPPLGLSSPTGASGSCAIPRDKAAAITDATITARAEAAADAVAEDRGDEQGAAFMSTVAGLDEAGPKRWVTLDWDAVAVMSTPPRLPPQRPPSPSPLSQRPLQPSRVIDQTAVIQSPVDNSAEEAVSGNKEISVFAPCRNSDAAPTEVSAELPCQDEESSTVLLGLHSLSKYSIEEFDDSDVGDSEDDSSFGDAQNRRRRLLQALQRGVVSGRGALATGRDALKRAKESSPFAGDANGVQTWRWRPRGLPKSQALNSSPSPGSKSSPTARLPPASPEPVPTTGPVSGRWDAAVPVPSPKAKVPDCAVGLGTTAAIDAGSSSRTRPQSEEPSVESLEEDDDCVE